jgi:hypothetical protein
MAGGGRADSIVQGVRGLNVRGGLVGLGLLQKKNVEAGGLISYGPNYSDMYRLTASYLDKILRGSKPNDLPVHESEVGTWRSHCAAAATASGIVRDPHLRRIG